MKKTLAQLQAVLDDDSNELTLAQLNRDTASQKLSFSKTGRAQPHLTRTALASKGTIYPLPESLSKLFTAFYRIKGKKTFIDFIELVPEKDVSYQYNLETATISRYALGSKNPAIIQTLDACDVKLAFSAIEKNYLAYRSIRANKSTVATITRQQLVDAIDRVGNLEQAAMELSISISTAHRLVKRYDVKLSKVFWVNDGRTETKVSSMPDGKQWKLGRLPIDQKKLAERPFDIHGSFRVYTRQYGRKVMFDIVENKPRFKDLVLSYTYSMELGAIRYFVNGGHPQTLATAYDKPPKIGWWETGVPNDFNLALARCEKHRANYVVKKKT